MKTRGAIDLYMPRRWAYHTKIIIVSALGSVFVKLFSGEAIWDQGTLFLFIMLGFQLEFFIWLGTKFFSNITYTSPNEYARKAIIKLILFFLFAFFISVLIVVLFSSIQYLINGEDLKLLIPHILKIEIKGFLIGAGGGYLFGSLVFFYFEWTDALKREQKQREEKLIFQYETLKNQVNPHFLFNSLNTLSSLVSKNANLSEEYIQKLSAIYRYILENKDLDHVNLRKEIDFIKDYFYLQKVRDDGKIELNINIKDSDNYLILPISLQLLVENSFKHNIATRKEPLIITIDLNEQDRIITVSNHLKPKTQIEESPKIGLANLSERIKLFTGREIEIIQSDSEFIVHVPLKKSDDESINH